MKLVDMEATDPWTPAEYVRNFMPVVDRHISKKWSWIGRRGNCLTDVEDVRQIARVALIDLANKYESITDLINPPRVVFWSMLEKRVKWAVLEFANSRSTRTADDTLDQSRFDDDAEAEGVIRTSLYKWRPPSMLQNDLVDFFSILPPKDKLLLALRYFDELPVESIAGLYSVSRSSASRSIGRISTRFGMFAMNQCTTEVKELPKRNPSAEPAPADVVAYIRREYGSDVSGYLGYVTRCMRVDVSYLVDILDRSDGVRLLKGVESKRVCVFEGCTRKYHARGLCELHYRRARNEGNLADHESVHTSSRV